MTRFGVFDVDDTVLGPNEEFIHHGVLMLGGEEVRINPSFKPTGDTLINLREGLGSINPATNLPFGRDWDYQCKVERSLTFEEHLKLQYEDVLHRVSVEQAIEFATLTMRPLPGVEKLFRRLKRHDVQTVFATNGGDAISIGVLQHFFGDILGQPQVAANQIIDGKHFFGRHGEVGLDKRLVVEELGNVFLFAGDSGRGDGPGALATAKKGGHVLAVGHTGEGSLAHFCQQHLPSRSWRHITSYERLRRAG